METTTPILLDFPLRGEWISPTTPGDRIPSHGTDALGQRYAYDFFRVDRENREKFYKGETLKFKLFGVRTNDCYCYGEPIVSPVSGRVVAVVSNAKEPKRVHPIIDLLRVLKNTVTVTFQSLFIPAEKLQLSRYIGNHIIIETEGVYAFFAHIAPNSIALKVGDLVQKGDVLGKVGHTGNSTAPHLHFHIMDSPNLLTAKGLPLAFAGCERFDDGQWTWVTNYIPQSSDYFRCKGAED